MFSRDHPWGKEIQVYSNKVPRVMYGHTPRGLNFDIVIYLGRTTRLISTKLDRKQ